MAFRKRNIPLGTPANRAAPTEKTPVIGNLPGVRPSPLTSHPVTSTGTSSLDGLLGGHAGLALGTSLLIEESGNTEFSSVLLRNFAAEGICQGHVLHVVGVGEGWVRDLPDVAVEKSGSRSGSKTNEEKMKIAWRYERLGQVGERASPGQGSVPAATDAQAAVPFCHTFDLSKRITVPADAKINHIRIDPRSAFETIIASLNQSLKSSPPNIVHRLIVPSMLSPALYPPTASHPSSSLKFLHSLRSLLRSNSDRLTAILSLPLELHPRTTGLLRWTEILADGVLELTPFPHLMDAYDEHPRPSDGAKEGGEDQPQGLARIHKLPLITERGEGGAGVGNSIGEDLAFVVSRRKFVLKPFSLPPVEGDQDAQKEGGKLTGKDIEF